MNIFGDYEDRSALLRDLDASISEKKDDDGRIAYRLTNSEADELRVKIDAAQKASAREAKLRQELEARLDEMTKERAEAVAELERVRKAAPSESRDDWRRSVEQASASRARIAALEAELKPLREENAAFKAREVRSKIETQLVDEARKLDCCESALRDVKRLAPLFHLDDDGLALTKDNKLVVEVLREELELSPHWLNRSQGASASPGTVDRPLDFIDRFRQALKGRDFADVLRCAPRENVERRY